MIVDGKQIANDMRVELARLGARLGSVPALTVLISQETAVIRKFIAIKKKFAESLGVPVIEKVFSPLTTEKDFLHAVFKAGHESDGIVVQLPLSHRISLEMVRQILPASHDVDVLGITAYGEFVENRIPLLPPVVGAIAEIVKRHQQTLRGKKVVVIGSGLLVGAPALVWATRMGGSVSVVTKETESLKDALSDADVIISGAGSPGLITADMVKEGVMVFDAGTSEVEGKLLGDVDPACAEHAALFTPTPGGIGPITVAMIFKNLFTLTALRRGVPLDGIEAL